MTATQTVTREPRTRGRFNAGATIRVSRGQAAQFLKRVDSVDLSNGVLLELRRAGAAVSRGQSYQLSRDVVTQIGDSLRVAGQQGTDDSGAESYAMTVPVAIGIAVAAFVIGVGIGWATGDVGEDGKGSTVTVTNEGDGTVTINGGGDGDDEE